MAACLLACCTGAHNHTWHAVQGTSAGAKDQEADNFLEKRCRGDPTFSFEETVQTAIAALQSVLSEDFKASEIEARVYTCSSVHMC